MISRAFVTTLLAVGIITALLYCSCSTGVSGVETTNGFTVVATARSIEGTAPPFAQVFLFDTGYIPFVDTGFGFGTSVDLDSSYRFPALPGVYNLLVITADGSAAGLQRQTVAAEERTASPQTFTLEKSGAVSGAIDPVAESRYLVYLPGTGYYTVITGTSEFSFSPLPAGNHSLRVRRIDDSGRASGEIITAVPFEVFAGESSDIGVIPVE